VQPPLDQFDADFSAVPLIDGVIEAYVQAIKTMENGIHNRISDSVQDGDEVQDESDNDGDEEEDLDQYSTDIPTDPEHARENIPSPKKTKAHASKYDEIEPSMLEFLHADLLPVGHPACGCLRRVMGFVYHNHKAAKWIWS